MNYNQAAAGFSIELQSSGQMGYVNIPSGQKKNIFLNIYITKYTKMAKHILVKTWFYI